MKRWGFRGQPASHGVSLTHRSLGATGARQDPGKVWKGKKMHGRMGGDNRTMKSLLLYEVNTKLNLLLVKGCVPGRKGTLLRITDATFKPFEKPPPFPTFLPQLGELEKLPPSVYAEMKKPWPKSAEPEDAMSDEEFKKKMRPDHSVLEERVKNYVKNQREAWKKYNVNNTLEVRKQRRKEYNVAKKKWLEDEDEED